MDSSVIIMIASILLVLVVTGMIAFMVSGAKSTRKKHVMNVIRGSGHEAVSKKGNPQDMRREALAKKLKESSDAEKKKEGKTLSEMIMQAGLEISVRQYWLYSVLLAVLLVALVAVAGKGIFVMIMMAVIGLFGIPKLVLKRLAKRRQKKFMEDLADALESMTRLLRAGMPVSEAIKMVAREYTGPIGEEMGRIFDQQKIGVSLPDAVASCAKRMPLTEVKMFATAVSIQAQTGSSLSEILENLAKVIRARFKLRRKVQALSSEAKSSAAIIGALPVLVATAMYFINPEYIGTLFHTATGKMLLAGAVFWMCVGVFIMKQMINFKV